MFEFWLIVAGVSLFVGTFLYWVSRPPTQEMEFWWVIPRVIDYVVARRYMRVFFGVTPPRAELLHEFTWVGPFSRREAERFPRGALWVVPIMGGDADSRRVR